MLSYTELLYLEIRFSPAFQQTVPLCVVLLKSQIGAPRVDASQ